MLEVLLLSRQLWAMLLPVLSGLREKPCLTAVPVHCMTARFGTPCCPLDLPYTRLPRLVSWSL